MSHMMTRKEVAERLGVSARWLEDNRKVGPPFYRYNAQTVRYKVEDVEAWLRQRRSQ